MANSSLGGGSFNVSYAENFPKTSKNGALDFFSLKRCKMIIYIIKTHKNLFLVIAARAARRNFFEV